MAFGVKWKRIKTRHAYRNSLSIYDITLIASPAPLESGRNASNGAGLSKPIRVL